VKLNLGCGFKKRPGFVNCDVQPACNPDRLIDLESLPWPFEDSVVDEILLSHVLEHLGESSKVYLGIIKEIYRVCAPEALVSIIVPYPLHDDFLIDPTHVRPIMPAQFGMFSKKECKRWREGGYGVTPLADYIDVDFEIEDVRWILDERWTRRMRNGEFTSEQLTEMAKYQFNIVRETQIQLRVKKG